MNAPLKKTPARIVFRCERCHAPDDSVCGCPDFYSRPETLQAMRLARTAGRPMPTGRGNADEREAYEEDAYDRAADK